MLVDRLQPEDVSLQTASPPDSPSSTAQNPSKNYKPGADPVIADQVQVPNGKDAKLGEITLQKELRNHTAAAIRATDQAAEVLGQKIDAAKKPLLTIVKNFPPFSQEDKERMELLRSYTGLRKEIDQLTIPAPPSVVEARKELPLPEPLGLNPDDSQIADHVAKLDAAAEAISGLRSGLAAETGAILRDGRFSDIFSGPKGSSGDVSGAGLTESAAAQKSAEIGQQFAESVSQGVTAQYPQFLKGLS
ncbi:hypothetical protein Gbem_3745 [Citrifermentans bemidjiense Bem]|uniref:Uncharacterized protein n=1 Tax=Citrifermentans bemidjiense (strain ATCC BAA-1014 / DSM 16622 / JCM 12645 / Bem) TaxID=404380 RepID=B5EDV9_CITBB|nr:hypothetical protein [Citrifermentans bemidjiense]ACH40737.1 hypothetical protein Gbem_3745 [Citrifermentans bemidjiense Bem]